MKFINYILAIIIAIFFLACDNEDEGGMEMISGSVTLLFDNVAGEEDLTFVADASTEYNLNNALGQAFNVDLLGYYVTEIKLTGMEGTEDYYDQVDYSADEPLGFYLVNETAEGITGNSIMLHDVPVGHYTSLEFTLGVKTEYLSEGAQGGDLSEANGMVWSWNSGYISYKLEGTVAEGAMINHGGRVAMTSSDAPMAFHVGGEGTNDNEEAFSNIKTISLDLSNHVVMSPESTSMVHVELDVLKTFTGSSDIDFTQMSVVHSPAMNEPVGENLTSAFSVTSVHNDSGDHIHE